MNFDSSEAITAINIDKVTTVACLQNSSEVIILGEYRFLETGSVSEFPQ